LRHPLTVSEMIFTDFQRGLAERDMTGRFALDTLAFGLQMIVRLLQFADEPFHLRNRFRGYFLNQSGDIASVQGRFVRRLGR
jgi:hypothetical protein